MIRSARPPPVRSLHLQHLRRDREVIPCMTVEPVLEPQRGGQGFVSGWSKAEECIEARASERASEPYYRIRLTYPRSLHEQPRRRHPTHPSSGSTSW